MPCYFEVHILVRIHSFYTGPVRNWIGTVPYGARYKLWGVSGSEDRRGGDNSIQFINIRRVGDKSFKEWRRKMGGWKGGPDNSVLTFLCYCSTKNATLKNCILGNFSLFVFVKFRNS